MCSFHAGDYIISQGQEGEDFYFIFGPKNAEVEVTRSVNGTMSSL
jgi:hypothetical protein